MTPIMSKVYMEPCQAFLMELVSENSWWYLVVNCFHKKLPSKMCLRINNPFQAFRITNNATQIVPFNE